MPSALDTGVIDTLNRHPIAADQAAQDYIMPTTRSRQSAGRFRIYGENQDVYYCFVYDGDEVKVNPPVYFETCLDLSLDYGIGRSQIIDESHVLVADRFIDFLWHILGHHICTRMESSGGFRSHVTGIVSNGLIELDNSFVNPLGREFPSGYTCFVSDDVICVPQWGAAFRTVHSRKRFLARYSPHVSSEWA